MLRASADTIAKVCGGTVLFGAADAYGNGVAMDSRECTPGCVFVALPGERTDGHDHLVDAMRAGARILVVARPRERLITELGEALLRGVAAVAVEDGPRAVQDLASWHRGRLLCPVIGVTGSTGKTSTKDFMRAALSERLHVASTIGNRNNELGVPLTLFAAGSDTDALIVEMGMRGVGQIEALCRIARPTLGLVTNVGTSHVEVVGSEDGIARAKGELVEAIPVDGAVFLNGDDGRSQTLASRSAAPVILYGTDAACEVRGVDIRLDEAGHAEFTLVSPQGDVEVVLPLPGRHNVYNALAAASVALRLAVSLEEVARGLARAEMTPMRMETFLTASGVSVINDAYNANPTSMRAAIDTLAGVRSEGRRVAVLGDMAELGTLSDVAHLEIGEAVAAAGIDTLVAVGRRARRIAEGARAAGMDSTEVRPCATVEEAVEVLDDLLNPGDVVLVKASRVMGLEAVVEGLVTPRAG